MTHEEILTGLIEKLRRNREKIPLSKLKTVYADSYHQLCQTIWEEIRHITVELPDCLKRRAVEEPYVTGLISVFEKLLRDENYEEKLGTAAFRDMDPEETIRIAHNLRSAFQAEARGYIMKQTCICASESCFSREHPQPPKIYNRILNRFWDEQLHIWRDPKEEELGNSILIVLKA